ncbi:hypothetical protein ALI144C_22625 [Actinosynnema sp. ALI-1.44]|uniref:pentapeptide repeat-containing protein n=1 Tax=Actinosynnema sp. ALI-1.44 TaxID=1933779 RepID=UPI00097C3C07|nr:pentapeptide repeat-containing protein [Actinosynnema sp. ALI-1.44]ONI81313.1 hypothetical protein ALI144C_22625 [Actinosynnema sp. ALI-1.44]
MVLVAVAAVWLLLGFGLDRDRLDAIRTGGTLGVGLGGVVVLWLAVRRQRSTELDLLQKYEAHQLAERVAAHAREDAVERRITELYTKAVEQLGSEKAPVRLGGLYALERLANNNFGQRQPIVNVLCAYLRMPYTLPDAQLADDADDTTRAIHEQRVQEREVRLAAQRILSAHLRPDPNFDQPDETFWAGMDLDLAGATLINLQFQNCRINNCTFDGAEFTGPARFDGAEFTEEAVFISAKFTGQGRFDSVESTGAARFDGAKFVGDALFASAEFAGSTGFASAEFPGFTKFDGAEFALEPQFDGVTFHRGTPPEVARFMDGQPGAPADA